MAFLARTTDGHAGVVSAFTATSPAAPALAAAASSKYNTAPLHNILLTYSSSAGGAPALCIVKYENFSGVSGATTFSPSDPAATMMTPLKMFHAT
jgi:hypothetical protein